MKYSGIFLMQWYSIVILLIALFCGPRVEDTMSDFRNFGITFIFQGVFPRLPGHFFGRRRESNLFLCAQRRALITEPFRVYVTFLSDLL